MECLSSGGPTDRSVRSPYLFGPIYFVRVRRAVELLRLACEGTNERVCGPCVLRDGFVNTTEGAMEGTLVHGWHGRTWVRRDHPVACRAIGTFLHTFDAVSPFFGGPTHS